MVARVFGTVDGVEVVLEHADKDRWLAPVPLDKDGEYVVEIIAEDEAGNQTYMAKMLFVVNTALLCVNVIQMPYYGVLQEKKFKSSVLHNPVSTSVLESKFSTSVHPAGYYAEIIEPVCGLAGRRT